MLARGWTNNLCTLETVWMLRSQEQLEAAEAAASSTEQQLARVLADWRASVAQMAATQARLVAPPDAWCKVPSICMQVRIWS